MAKKIKIVNHRGAQIHLPHPVQEKVHITFHPGVNEIDADLWKQMEEHRMTKAFVDDQQLEVGGRPSASTTPSLKEFIDAGYEPSAYKSRFPGARVDEKELREAQMAWQAEKDSEEKARRGQQSGTGADLFAEMARKAAEEEEEEKKKAEAK